MAFCRNCGAAVGENAAFCTSCGAQLGGGVAQATAQPVTQPGAQPAQAARGGMHCPNCKSTQLTPINETSLDGAITATRGRMGATKFANTHRNYWMCSNCGTKFRSIPNLESEIAATKKSAIVNFIVSGIALIVTIFLITALTESPLMIFFYGSMTFTFALVTIICLCMGLSKIFKGNKMKDELAYLKHHCFH